MPVSAAAPAAPVPAGARLAYVLRHFGRAYQDVPPVAIGYAEAEAAVVVTEGAGLFFEQNQPYPPAPNWRDWGGQQVPFFFDNDPDAPLLELEPGRAFIGADLVSAAFYLLSGWQEYFSETRDQHGRFPYAASVQQQYGFMEVPTVNYYFDVLRAAVEHVSGRPLRPRRWAGPAGDVSAGAGAGAPFAAFVSHDIDNLHSAWKAPARAALRQGRLLGFARQLWRRLSQPDAWDNLEAVAAAVAAHGARSTFFVLPAHRPAPDGTPNADYRLDRRLQARLRRLADQGHEIGLHASLGADCAESQLRAERQRLDPEATEPGLRFHYLRWDPRRTPALLDAAGFRYDATLGFAEHFGFRNSYCHPFYPFDFERGEEHGFLEIPLVVMDATLHHPRYLQLSAADVLPRLQPVFAEITRFGGVASVLWHNQNFDPANQTNGPAQFEQIMADLRQCGAAFLTGREIWEHFPADKDAGPDSSIFAPHS